MRTQPGHSDGRPGRYRDAAGGAYSAASPAIGGDIGAVLIDGIKSGHDIHDTLPDEFANVLAEFADRVR